jgi:hypothetical protein
MPSIFLREIDGRLMGELLAELLVNKEFGCDWPDMTPVCCTANLRISKLEKEAEICWLNYIAMQTKYHNMKLIITI